MSEDPSVGVTEGPPVELNMGGAIDYAQMSRFYANNAQVNVSLFEIRMQLSFVIGINPQNGNLQAPETMLISMSPELAETLYRLLGGALGAYRRDYGDLRSPKRRLGDEEQSTGDPNPATETIVPRKPRRQFNFNDEE